MIAVLLTMIASAADPSAMFTAETIEPGAAVVRQPTGPSAWGLAEGTVAWITPVDIGMGGPRLGVQQQLIQRGHITWSVQPSVASKVTLRRYALRLASTVSLQRGEHHLSLTPSLDTRWIRRADLGTSTTRTLSADRVQSSLVLVHDWSRNRSTVRTQVTLPLRDRRATLGYGSGSASYVHRFGRLHTQTGVGVLVGRPRDQYLLGRYHYNMVVPFPKLDIWLTL